MHKGETTIILFGFEINRKRKEEPQDTQKTFSVDTQNDDGAVVIQSGAYYGTYVDLDGVVRNEVELVSKYRDMAMQAELETAIDEIVNEAIVIDSIGNSIVLNTDKLEQSDKIKKVIQEEFDGILKLLNFANQGHDIFRRWYIDGRLPYHVIIDDNNPTNGIQEVKYIDPRRIRKIREVQKTRDPRTGMELIKQQVEYFLYNERGVMGANSNLGTRIAVDSIVYVTSGLLDAKRAMVLSYLHKAIKPLNQLRMIEDATVIYKLSRAPDRRVFYVDTGNMNPAKSEQYLQSIMTKYRNKLVYDANTGEIKDDRKFLSMLEDFWIPRREGSKATEIQTLPGGENLGSLEDVKYFQRKLYQALGVPVSRLEGQNGFTLGRTTEITRDELKFTKFVQRLRNKFSTLFDDLMRIQLVLKRVCTEEEWKEMKEDIFYDFGKDNNFEELKEQELLMSRLQVLQMVDPFASSGKYYSMEWVRKNILRQTDEEMEEIDAQMGEEQAVIAQQMADQQMQQAEMGMAIDQQAGQMQQDQANQGQIEQGIQDRMNFAHEQGGGTDEDEGEGDSGRPRKDTPPILPLPPEEKDKKGVKKDAKPPAKSSKK